MSPVPTRNGGVGVGRMRGPRCKGSPAETARPLAAAGFTLLEVLLAVTILGLVAGVALYSRGVTLRAEHKAERLDEARRIMRELVTLERADASRALRASSLPPDWRLTTQTVVTATRHAAAGRNPMVWRIWRLEHPPSDTRFDVAFEPPSELRSHRPIPGDISHE